MKTWGSEGVAPPLLISASGGGEWSNLRSGRFSLEETVPGIHYTEKRVSPRAGLGAMEKRKMLFLILRIEIRRKESRINF
jgi:hypothetical protein